MYMQNMINTWIRFWKNLYRPSKQSNLKRIQQKGQNLDALVIREANATDVPALADLHVKTWQETYSGSGPSQKTREYQWRELFQEVERKWFVLVIETQERDLIGYAKGQPYQHADLPEFNGELNKIYLLRDYQRLGLGRRLVGKVAPKMLDRGMTNMVLFGIPQNPSCAFHEALGGERLYDQSGVFHGGYCWRDFSVLLENCKG